MKLVPRLLGAAAIAVGALYTPPVWADGGTLVIVSSQVPRHLNGAVQSGIATAVPSTQIFASPLRYDENWEPQPYLAESWEVAEDGLSVTLNLVEGATFHDGEPITSEDVAFSIMTTKENHPFKSMFAPVEGVDTPDAQTAVIRLSQPHPALLLSLSPALAPVLPKHIYGDGQDVASHPRNSTDVVGSGPFMLQEFTAGEAIVLKKNPEIKVEINGHTDNTGSAAYNMNLSERRAKSVMNYFVDKGIESERLTTKGFGFNQPVESNATEQGRTQNRRVEFTPVK